MGVYQYILVYFKQLRKDGWMDDCDFMFFSTVFKSYQDNGWVIMKGFVPWNPVYD